MRDGLEMYIDKKTFPTTLAPSGLRLTRVEQEMQGIGKILAEKKLSDYRKIIKSTSDAKNAQSCAALIFPSKIFQEYFRLLFPVCSIMIGLNQQYSQMVAIPIGKP